LGMHRQPMVEKSSPTARPAITHDTTDRGTPHPDPAISPLFRLLHLPNRHPLTPPLPPNSRLNSSPPPPKVSLCPSKS
jgi:hypothetical protein